MARVKYFVNRHEPDAKKISDKLQAANIDFSCIPTSGPMMLVIDDIAYYGPTDVNYAVDRLVADLPEELVQESTIRVPIDTKGKSLSQIRFDLSKLSGKGPLHNMKKLK